MVKINIITQLVIFLVAAISINLLNLKLLIGLFIFLLALLLLTKNNKFLRSLLRFKWFFIVMLLIFAFNTPGEHVQGWPFSFSPTISPTYEGLVAGATQSLRILLMLAGLSLIMACNTRQQLISGLYFIVSPLKYLGFKVERFAARLWLTLHYVEQQKAANNSQDFMTQLKNMAMLKLSEANQDVNEDVSVTLIVPRLHMADYVVLAILLIIVTLYLFKVFA